MRWPKSSAREPLDADGRRDRPRLWPTRSCPHRPRPPALRRVARYQRLRRRASATRHARPSAIELPPPADIKAYGRSLRREPQTPRLGSFGCRHRGQRSANPLQLHSLRIRMSTFTGSSIGNRAISAWPHRGSRVAVYACAFGAGLLPWIWTASRQSSPQHHCTSANNRLRVHEAPEPREGSPHAISRCTT